MRQLATPRKALQEIADIPDGMYRGKLAEDYDGIGQYVMVSLSGASVGSGFKSRIAAGDFGGSRTFPAGTPVRIFSYRGQLETFLGNLPGCKCGDNFNRVEAVALGDAPGLGTYTYPGGGSSKLVLNGAEAEFKLKSVSPPENAQARVTSPESIELPFEVLFKLRAVSKSNPFLGWRGSGTAGFDTLQFFFELTEADNFPYSLLTLATFGTFPSTTLGFNQDDTRINIGSVDFNDVTIDWPESSPEVDFYFRYLVDDFGVYGRAWYVDQDEPTTTAPGLLIPFNNSAAWQATEGGKGEAWHVYEACAEGFTPIPFTLFTFGNNSVAGTDPYMFVDEYCIIQGGWC